MKRGLITFAIFLVCVLAAFLMRTWHYNTSVYALGKAIRDVPAHELKEPGMLPAYHKNFSPFTIESAMMFTYAQDIALGKGVPARDPLLNGIEHIPPYGQMNMALEWFLGWGWQLKNAIAPDPEPAADELRFQDHPRMAQWMSGQLRFWASLTSGLIFLWLVVMGCPRRFAVLAGLLHAVSPAAIARATGQDIVRGEFCIPLIMGAVVLAYSIYKSPRLWKYILLFAVTALAFTAWDLCQMLFGAWALFELLRFTLGRPMTRPRLYVWAVIAGAVLFNAAFVPFNQVYSLWRAQLVWTVLPALFLMYALSFHIQKKTLHRPVWYLRAGAATGVMLILYGIWLFAVNTPEYASNYSHFSEAMNAKLAFWNVKPLDPAKLSYDARILWTPSMTSATWESANTFFPSLNIRDISFRPLQFVLGYMPAGPGLFALLVAGTFLSGQVRRYTKRRSEASLMPILFTIGFLIGFIYIIRYHEFLIIFLAASLALLCRDYAAALKKWYGCIPALLFCGLFCYEAVISYNTRRHYTGDVAMGETAALIAWMRSQPETFAGKGVAANITTGPMLRAYAGTGVVMNPQFGIKVIRDATEEFLMTLYHGTEDDLADYCRRRNSRFVLFRRVNPDEVPPILNQQLLYRSAKNRDHLEQLKRFYTAAWVYSNRYIANAVQVPQHAVCRALYRASDPVSPETAVLKKFRQVGRNIGHYAMFEYVGDRAE